MKKKLIMTRKERKVGFFAYSPKNKYVHYVANYTGPPDLILTFLEFLAILKLEKERR